MKKIIGVATIATVAAVVALVVVYNRPITVKIGVAAPLTGAQGDKGQDLLRGAQIAIAELNEDRFRINGKRAQFELVMEDDKASPEEAKNAAKRLVDQSVVAVYGHLNSGASIAAAPVYANANIPQMTASTNPKYTRMGLKTTFRIGADDIAQGAAGARIIVAKIKAKSVYLVDDRTMFGAGLTDEVEKALKSKNIPAQRESIDLKAADYKALAQKIRETNADTVFFGGDEPGGLALLKEMRSAGSTAKYVAGDSMCDPLVIKNAGGTADNNYYCTVPGIPPSWLSDGIGFRQAFKEKFSSEPGAFAPVAYDGVHVLVQAMQRANSTDPAIYLPELTKGTYDGKVQGAVEFDSKGDVKEGTVVVYQSLEGKLTEMRDFSLR
jgi:branched-chain amino acid transport system substrate-binding protein